MRSIVFFDTEIGEKSDKILDIGGIRHDDKTFHSNSLSKFLDFCENAEYICGHNIIKHDLKYINKEVILKNHKVIDTLYWSPLLFPSSPYHALVKDDKLHIEELNNPLNDSKKARTLFDDELTAFNNLDTEFKDILYFLLYDKLEFKYFFDFIDYKGRKNNLKKIIRKSYKNLICEKVDLDKIILDTPVELAYCLALISVRSRTSIMPPWVRINYIMVEGVMHKLRNKKCRGCKYCSSNFFLTRQEHLKKLKSGDVLTVDGVYCLDSSDRKIIRFSEKFNDRIDKFRRKGYVPTKAIIRFIVAWQKKDTNKEVRIVLAEISFKQI